MLQSFANYMDAHILMGKLEAEGIDSWLKDENTVTTGPFLTNAIGGVKVMVAKEQFEQASQILQQIDEQRRKNFCCPQCGSSDIELVTTPRKLSNWLGAIGGFLFGNFAIGVDKVWHCFNCKAEFKEPKETDHS